jgi:Na+(H+)/acetate symporter ActP
MQFFILFVGAMVFVFYLFAQPPMLFESTAMKAIQNQPGFTQVDSRYKNAWSAREKAAESLNAARKREDDPALGAAVSSYRAAQHEIDSARQAGIKLYEKSQGHPGFNDTNYVFLTFVTKYFPVGVIGLVIAVILNAAMSSSSGELNSLAAVSVMDLYRRLFRPDETDRHYLLASRVFTAMWGLWAVIFAQYAKNLGSLVEAVNQVGSYFYPVLLGVFVLAFFFPKVKGSAAFWAMLSGQLIIVLTSVFTHVAFLWFNVIGTLAVVVTGILYAAFAGDSGAKIKA